MRILSSFICLLSILCFLVSRVANCEPISVESQSDSLALTLTLDTTEFLYGESIAAQIKLKNISDRTVYVWDIRCSTSVSSITDQNGNKLSDRGFWVCGPQKPNYAMPPGDSIFKLCNLCRGYGFADEPKRENKRFSVGKVLLRANYVNELHTAFVPIHLIISAEEDSVVRAGIRCAVGTSGSCGPKESLQLIDSLIATYPSSRYIPGACEYGIYAAGMARDTVRILKYSRILVQSFPNHDFAIAGFDNILAVMPPTSIASFCDSIATTYPNTRVGARALEKLAALKVEKH